MFAFVVVAVFTIVRPEVQGYGSRLLTEMVKIVDGDQVKGNNANDDSEKSEESAKTSSSYQREARKKIRIYKKEIQEAIVVSRNYESEKQVSKHRKIKS